MKWYVWTIIGVLTVAALVIAGAGFGLYSFGDTIKFGSIESIGLSYSENWSRFSADFTVTDKSAYRNDPFALSFYTHRGIAGFTTPQCGLVYGVSQTAGSCYLPTAGTYCGSTTEYHCAYHTEFYLFYDWMDRCFDCWDKNGNRMSGCQAGTVADRYDIIGCTFSEEDVFSRWNLDEGASYFSYTVSGHKEIAPEDAQMYDPVDITVLDDGDTLLNCQVDGYGRLQKNGGELRMVSPDLQGCEGMMQVSVHIEAHHSSVLDGTPFVLPFESDLDTPDEIPVLDDSGDGTSCPLTVYGWGPSAQLRGGGCKLYQGCDIPVKATLLFDNQESCENSLDCIAEPTLKKCQLGDQPGFFEKLWDFMALLFRYGIWEW